MDFDYGNIIGFGSNFGSILGYFMIQFIWYLIYLPDF